MRKSLTLGLLAAVASLAFAGTASAQTWQASDSGTSYSNGVVTLNNEGPPTNPDGTSYENSDLQVPVQGGDTITFEWRTDDGSCGGGVPRVFIRGGAYNTHNGNLAQCNEPADSDGWRTWTATVSSSIAPGDAGHTGIVNDNPSNPSILEVRNLVIGGTAVNLASAPTNAGECKKGGWQATGTGFKNQGQCVSSFAKNK
jgi:hypothetical protein